MDVETSMNLMPEQATLLLPFRTTNSGPPLRVGIVLDRDPSPWVDALLGFLKQIPGIDVRLLTIAHRTESELRRPAWLTDRLYSASRARFDPFGNLVLNGTAYATPESLEAIREAECGVIIWLADCQDRNADLYNVAKHGVFSVLLGGRKSTIPFWDEVAHNSVTSTATILWHDRSFAQARAVRIAETSTLQGLFVTANAEQPLVAVIRMFGGLCLEIQCDGGRFEERVRALLTQTSDEVEHACPSNFQAARFVVQKLARSTVLRWTSRGKKQNWFVAMRPNRGASITDPARIDLSGFQTVPLPNGVEAMADPFLWEAGGSHYLLFEEVAAGQSRGRLGCVEVLPDASCSEMKVILQRPYHLSYPCVVPVDGELFLLPESSEANRIELYRFSRFPWEMELVSSPVEGVALVDTTPVFVNGRWYFFTTTIEPFLETLLFSATRLEGPWKLHPRNPVSSSVRSCRSAGHLFWKDGRLFRPTQDCSVRYGYGIALNEVTRLTPDEFEERPVSHIPPTWMRGLLGTHTWNEDSAFQVVDGIRFSQ
jgi:hypothetical protein